MTSAIITEVEGLLMLTDQPEHANVDLASELCIYKEDV